MPEPDLALFYSIQFQFAVLPGLNLCHCNPHVHLVFFFFLIRVFRRLFIFLVKSFPSLSKSNHHYLLLQSACNGSLFAIALCHAHPYSCIFFISWQHHLAERMITQQSQRGEGKFSSILKVIFFSSTFSFTFLFSFKLITIKLSIPLPAFLNAANLFCYRFI